MGLLDKWNKNKFSIYKSEEKTVLKLIESLGKWLEELIKVTENKTDLYGDHKGSWQGINKPTLSEEGLRGTVEKHIEDINNIQNSLEMLNKKLELNIKDFGAKGDGVTDDTDAIQSAFDYIKEMQTNNKSDRAVTLFFPNGVYIINRGFDLDINVVIKGEVLSKTPFYRLFGMNVNGQETRPNATTIKYDSYKNGTTMFKAVNSADGFLHDISFEDIMLDGSDGKAVQIEASNGGSKDLIINFEGVNSNGVDLSALRFTRGSRNLMLVGFSGIGLQTGHWQHHENPIITLCGVGLVSGGDGNISNPLIAFCKTGIEIGTSSKNGVTDRFENIRVEWCEEYGINVINGGSNKISGFIDRCGYSGYNQPTATWNMTLDLIIQRCGSFYRGYTKEDLTTNEMKMKGSNAYIKQARGGRYFITHIRSTAHDTIADYGKSPVIASSIDGGIDFVSIDTTQGFTNKLLDDYYLNGLSDFTIISNNTFHSSNGIKVDINNKQVIDLYNQARFRPPTNWGKPADNVGSPGDMVYDTQNNVMYYKNATTWKQI